MYSVQLMTRPTKGARTGAIIYGGASEPNVTDAETGSESGSRHGLFASEHHDETARDAEAHNVRDVQGVVGIGIDR